MPNRMQAGYMPQYERNSDIKRNLARTAEVVERTRPRETEPAAIGRADLLDAGDFEKPYDQWSDGDLQNRAAQLGVRGVPAMKQQLIDAIRAAESKPLEQWTKTDLYNRAKALSIDGRSALTKRQLVNAIRRVEAAPAA